MSDAEDKGFLHSLQLTNFLSFGENSKPIELRKLNVIIGINGSGKSNFIKAIALLRATSTNLSNFFSYNGGVADFLWKGQNDTPIATVRTQISYENHIPLIYQLDFTKIGTSFQLKNEKIEQIASTTQEPKVLYDYQSGEPSITVSSLLEPYPKVGLQLDRSILTQAKGPMYPELTYLGNMFGNIKIYENWDTTSHGSLRDGQRSDTLNDFISEDGSNLGAVLNRLKIHERKAYNKIITNFKRLFPSIEEFEVSFDPGSRLQLFLREDEFAQPIPAARWSDGTLRFLALLTVLCHPSPPPLICIEEPETGLYSDVIPIIADLMEEASQHTQLIVTTHSDRLISSLRDPEDVLVCGRDQNGSCLDRLEFEKLKHWLKEYKLGDLRMMGEIGIS